MRFPNMAKKRRIPIKDLKKIKESFKENIKEADEEQFNAKEQIANAKSAARTRKISETGMTPRETKKAAKNKIKSIKKDFVSLRSVKATFNFDVGDLVFFKYTDGTEQVGIVCHMHVPANMSTLKEAKQSGSVTLLSSIGRINIKPMSVYKKID